MPLPAGRPLPDDARVRLQGRPVDYYPRLAPEVRRGQVRRVTEVGEEVLHRPCRDVAELGSPAVAKLVDDLFATMYVAEGVGLAANQVGVDLRLFVWDCLDDWGVRHVGHIVDPVLDPIPPGSRQLVGPEGCLSVPGATAEVARAEHAVVRGRDKDGRLLAVEGHGYFARCLQHETDHLGGRLYLDRLSSQQRKAALRDMEQRRGAVMARRARRADALARGADADQPDADV